MEFIEEYEAEQRYDDFIDESNPIVEIFGMQYNPSRVLKELDPIAYNCGLADYLDSLDLTTDESEADMDEEEDDYDDTMTLREAYGEAK
jgi:hypothetical protein